MNMNLTDITLIVDRSGSMHAIQSDAEGGVNAFIAEQAKQPSEALLTLVQFDTEYECLYNGIPVQKVPAYSLQPRGSTALLDAIGRTINAVGRRLSQMNEADRPGMVIVVVMTDGAENSSHEFTKAQIKSMIEHQQIVYKWHFTFLGANQDSFAEAGAMGITPGGAADWNMNKVGATMMAATGKIARMRKQFHANEAVSNDFTDEERTEMK